MLTQTRILNPLGIKTVVDLPGVGENLLEQPNHLYAKAGNLPQSSNAYHTFVSMKDLFGSNVTAVEKSTYVSIPKWAKQIVTASGPGALNLNAIKKLLYIQHDLLFNHNVTAAEVITVVATGIFASNFWILMPFSRGSVHLGSADKIDEPLYDPRLFLADFDYTATVGIAKLAQKYWLSKPINDYVTGEFPMPPGSEPIPDDATDAQWETFLRGPAREYLTSFLHFLASFFKPSTICL